MNYITFSKVVRFSSLEEEDLFSFLQDFVIFPIGLCRKGPNIDGKKIYYTLGNNHVEPNDLKQYHMNFGDPEVVKYIVETKKIIEIENVDE